MAMNTPINYILSKFSSFTEEKQKRVLLRLSNKQFGYLFSIYFPNKIISFNDKNNTLKQLFPKLSDVVIFEVFNKISKNNNLFLGNFIRKNIVFISELIPNRLNLVFKLSLLDSEFHDLNSDLNITELSKVYSFSEYFEDENLVKQFFILIQKNEELLEKLFNTTDPLWFNKINNLILKISQKNHLSDKILWNDLFISIQKRLNHSFNPGWDSILKNIFYHFIFSNYSVNYNSIYSILPEDKKHRFIHQNIIFHPLYLDSLIIPFYSLKNKNLLLSTLFLTKNKKWQYLLENRFFNYQDYSIDSCGLLFTASISELFSNYGLRQSFQRIMLNTVINQNLFFYGEFKDYFKDFIECLKFIIKYFGEARLLKLLSKCDWGEDVNVFAECYTGFIKIQKLKNINSELVIKRKPKNVVELHTLIFKAIGDYECNLQLIHLKKEKKTEIINGLKIKDYKFTIPETNVQLNQFSLEMNNCVRGYSDQINNKNSLIISIFKKNKAYANIEIVANKIKEIKGRFNKELPQEDLILFSQILQKYSIIS